MFLSNDFLLIMFLLIFLVPKIITFNSIHSFLNNFNYYIFFLLNFSYNLFVLYFYYIFIIFFNQQNIIFMKFILLYIIFYFFFIKLKRNIINNFSHFLQKYVFYFFIIFNYKKITIIYCINTPLLNFIFLKSNYISMFNKTFFYKKYKTF